MNLSLTDVEKIIQIAFFIVTGSVAVLGLKAWRAEMAGRVEFDVARRVVAGAYKIRDNIKRCQTAFMTADEYAERKPIPGESEAEKRANESYFAYGRRFNLVIEALNEWYPSTIEAEAVFGREAKLLMENLKQAIGHLRAAIDIYHRSIYHGRSNNKHEKYFNIIYGINEFETPPKADEEPIDDDNFQKNLDFAILEIEKFFLKHMHRKALDI